MGKVAKKIVETALSRTLWLARGTSVVVGLAVMLALVVGVASTALAGTGVGAALNLGQLNTVNAITKLVGSVTGPSLQVDNNSTDVSATALDLQVESGKPPMKVNSGTKVENLNADKLDGTDSTGFAQSVKPIKVVAAAQVRSDGRVNTSNSNVVGVTKGGTGLYHIQIAGIPNYNVASFVAIATATGSDGKVANTSSIGSEKMFVGIRDTNGALVDGSFSFVVYDPTP
jgi:hypothetical protein